jgi:hypothetical protein
MVLLTVGGLLAGDAGAARGPAPKLVVTSFRAEVRTSQGKEQLAWQAPERFAAKPDTGQPFFGRLSITDGTFVYRFSPEARASVLNRTFAARPDGFFELDRLRGSSEFVLGKARGGTPVFRTVKLSRRPTFRAEVFLRANDCAALPSGREELWLDQETLLPVRSLERRGNAIVRRVRLTYTDINRPLPAAAFAPPPLGKRPYRRDDGFRRTSPEVAARHVSYRAALPKRLPPGFALAVSGWAPRSGITGAEGSNPRYKSLFAAVYRRGFERIDVTQRLAGQHGWLNDPFGAECVFEFRERVTIGAAKGWYGAGPRTTPHLYWQSGRVLFTISGPYPKNDLLAIARSLAPVRR